MKKNLFIILCILIQSLYSQGALLKSLDDSMIRVRRLDQKTDFSFEGAGIVFNGNKEISQSVATAQKARWTVQLQNISGIDYWQVTQVYPAGKILLFSAEKQLAIFGQNISSNGNLWPGTLNLIKTENQKFDVLLNLPLNKYLIGVLNGEMPKSWPLSTLKAQAIAARSYAESIRNERKNFYFDIESDQRDQVFAPDTERGPNAPLTNQQRAVRETKNIILAKNNNLIKAYFHSDCGGESATAESVWGSSQSPSDLPGTCPSEKKSDWSYKIEESELFKKLKSIWSRFEVNLFSSLQWVHLPNTQRISDVKIELANGETMQFRSQEFRKALGFANLKSTLFRVQKNGSIYIFSGRGFGHGVGLCQWGAKTMGEAGYSFQKILTHYYPESELLLAHGLQFNRHLR